MKIINGGRIIRPPFWWWRWFDGQKTGKARSRRRGRVEIEQTRYWALIFSVSQIASGHKHRSGGYLRNSSDLITGFTNVPWLAIRLNCRRRLICRKSPVTRPEDVYELTATVEKPLGNNTHTFICNSSDYNWGGWSFVLFFMFFSLMKDLPGNYGPAVSGCQSSHQHWRADCFFLPLTVLILLIFTSVPLLPAEWPTSLRGIKTANLIPPPSDAGALGLQWD